MSLKIAIHKKDVKLIRKIVSDYTTSEIADLLETYSIQERFVFFRLLDSKKQSEIFDSLEPEFQEELFRLFSDEDIKELLDDLYSDDIADLVDDMPDELSTRILRNTPSERRNDINKLLKYDDDKTGSIMSVDIVLIQQERTVDQTINIIRKARENIEITNNVFIVDSKNKLVGFVDYSDLLFNDGNKKIKSISKPIASLKVNTDKEEAVNLFADHDHSSLPVVNSQNKVIGMITADDVIDVVIEEANEDIVKMSGQQVSDVPYSKQNIWQIYKSRILWLLLLMVSATLSQIVLDEFQKISQDIVGIITSSLMITILPVISGAAGNAGSQSSTSIIRSLVIGDIKTKDYKKIFQKELLASALIGLTLGIVNFLRLMIYYAAKGYLSDGNDIVDQGLTKFLHAKNIVIIVLSAAASIALFVVIILAKVVGGMLPLIAKKMKMDPAVMAAPLLTTLIDALSTLIFIGISISILYGAFIA